MGLSLYLAKNARLEIQQGAEWWRHPGIRGVTLNQDPTPREEIDTWEGSDAVLGNVPSPTLGYSGQSNFLHRAWLANVGPVRRRRLRHLPDDHQGTRARIRHHRRRQHARRGPNRHLQVREPDARGIERHHRRRRDHPEAGCRLLHR